MAPFAIVPAVDVVRQRARGGRPRAPRFPGEEFPRERREEALDHRIVPAIPASAHAADDPALREQRLVGGAGVLTSPVGVMQERAPGLPSRQRPP